MSHPWAHSHLQPTAYCPFMEQDNDWTESDQLSSLFIIFSFLSFLFSHHDQLIIKAQTYAAEAAGVMAENAKMFVAEKMEKVRYFTLMIAM